MKTKCAFEVTSKRRRGFTSETCVKRGERVVHGEKELLEKLGRNDLCPCGSGRLFQAVLPAKRWLSTVWRAITTCADAVVRQRPDAGVRRRVSSSGQQRSNAGGRRRQFAEVAQTVERRTEDARVGGSIPSLGTSQRPVSSAERERRITNPEVARSNRARGTTRRRGSARRRDGVAGSACVAQWQSSAIIGRRSVDRSHPQVPVVTRCGAAGSARDLGSRGRRFEPCHRDQL